MEEIGSLSSNQLCATHVNDFSWNSAGTHCVLVFPWESKPHPKQKTYQAATVRAENLPKIFIKRIDCFPHTKDVTCVSYIPDSNQFITSGFDKQVVHWNSEGKKTTVNVLHCEHTNKVNTICTHSGKNFIYTGGSDHKVISYSLNTSAIMNPLIKLEAEVCSIKENPTHPNLLLIW